MHARCGRAMEAGKSPEQVRAASESGLKLRSVLPSGFTSASSSPQLARAVCRQCCSLTCKSRCNRFRSRDQCAVAGGDRYEDIRTWSQLFFRTLLCSLKVCSTGAVRRRGVIAQRCICMIARLHTTWSVTRSRIRWGVYWCHWHCHNKAVHTPMLQAHTSTPRSNFAQRQSRAAAPLSGQLSA